MFLSESDVIQSLMVLNAYRAKSETVQPTSEMAKLGTVLSQEQVNAAVGRALEREVEDSTVEYSKAFIAPYLGREAIFGNAPYWVDVRALVLEPLRLNNPSFYMDLFTQAQVLDPNYLIGLIHAMHSGDRQAQSIPELAEVTTAGNSKFYAKSLVLACVSALIGSSFQVEESDIGYDGPLRQTTNKIALRYADPARNPDEYIERLRALFPAEQAQAKKCPFDLFENLVDGGAFKVVPGFIRQIHNFFNEKSELKPVACPAVGLAGKIFTGYGVALEDPTYVAALRKRIAYPA